MSKQLAKRLDVIKTIEYLDHLHVSETYIKEIMDYNGQTKSEYLKNFKRIKDIVEKGKGDKDVEVRLALTQCKLITDEAKAINRAMAAKSLGHDHIFETFFQRAYELGSVTKQEYREYKISKLGI
jgi:hypothetical protein